MTAAALFRRNLSPKQQTLLVEAIETQPALLANLTGYTDGGPITKAQLEAMWDDLGRTISSEPSGLTVDGKDLKFRWTKWKSRVKAKALVLRRIKTEHQGSAPELTALEKRLLVAIGDYQILELDENEMSHEARMTQFTQIIHEPERSSYDHCGWSDVNSPKQHRQNEKLRVVRAETPLGAFEADAPVFDASALKVELLPVDEFEEEPVSEGNDVHSSSAFSEVMCSGSSMQTSPGSAEEVSRGVQPDVLMHCEAGSSSFIADSPPQSTKKFRMRYDDPALPLLNEVVQQQLNMSRVMENIEVAVRDQAEAIRQQSCVIREASREQTKAVREQSEVLRQTNTILKELMSVLSKNVSK